MEVSALRALSENLVYLEYWGLWRLLIRTWEVWAPSVNDLILYVICAWKSKVNSVGKIEFSLRKILCVDKSKFYLDKIYSVYRIGFCLSQKLFYLQKWVLSDKSKFCRQNCNLSKTEFYF